MPAVIITGKTFDHRDQLKRLGGYWSAADKAWRIDRASDGDLRTLRSLVGCVVTVEDKQPSTSPAPIETDDNEPLNFDNIVAAIRSTRLKPVHGRKPSAMYGDDHRWHNYFKDRNATAFFGFSSLGAMVDYVEKIEPHKRIGERDAGWERDQDGGWHGTPNMDAAIKLARDGWTKGSELAAEVLHLFSIAHATKRKRLMSVAGGSVSVGRLLAGNPMHMRKRPKQPGNKIITLFVQSGNSAYISAESMIMRAAICAAVTDVLERQGYSCEIVSVWCNWGEIDEPAAQIATTIKHAGERLNLNDVVFALGHPSYLRRLCFACVCAADELRAIYGSQGYPTEAFTKEHLPGKSEFYIPGLSANFDDPKSMLRHILPLNMPLTIAI